ncbi:MAG: GNAT family protein [Gaiellaceae bacterium]
MGVTTPPYRIETERLVIRCYDPRDAPLLKSAVDASVDHLLPFMPWARFAPQPVEETVALLRSFRGQFDRDENYVYGVFTPDESELVAGSGLHKRSNEGSLEIGYWVAAGSVGQGIATEITAVLTRVGFELCGLDRVDLQIEPENELSLKIPRKLGFTLEGRLRRRLDPHVDGGPRRDSMMFTMLVEELAGSPCLAYDYVAYNAAGGTLETRQPG